MAISERITSAIGITPEQKQIQTKFLTLLKRSNRGIKAEQAGSVWEVYYTSKDHSITFGDDLLKFSVKNGITISIIKDSTVIKLSAIFSMDRNQMQELIDNISD
jgi:hypothetical protein